MGVSVELADCRRQMRMVAEYLKPNWSNDMEWADEIIIAIDQRVQAAAIPHMQPAGEAVEALSESDKDVALGQAVEFAQYVERQAKGAMVDAARKFLSLPYSQEIAARLTTPPQPSAEEAQGVVYDPTLADSIPGWCVTHIMEVAAWMKARGNDRRQIGGIGPATQPAPVDVRRIDAGSIDSGERPSDWDAVDEALLHWYGHRLTFSQSERQRFFDAIQKYIRAQQQPTADAGDDAIAAQPRGGINNEGERK